MVLLCSAWVVVRWRPRWAVVVRAASMAALCVFLQGHRCPARLRHRPELKQDRQILGNDVDTLLHSGLISIVNCDHRAMVSACSNEKRGMAHSTCPGFSCSCSAVASLHRKRMLLFPIRLSTFVVPAADQQTRLHRQMASFFTLARSTLPACIASSRSTEPDHLLVRCGPSAENYHSNRAGYARHPPPRLGRRFGMPTAHQRAKSAVLI